MLRYADARYAAAICFGTGDNGGFYSPDGGFDYVSGDYQQGDNDACFSDPVQPSMLFVFAPRAGNHGAVVVYTAPASTAANGGKGTSQGHATPGPVSNYRWAWNCISSNTEAGYRPLVLTLSGQAPVPAATSSPSMAQPVARGWCAPPPWRPSPIPTIGTRPQPMRGPEHMCFAKARCCPIHP